MTKKQNIFYPFFIFILFLSCQNFMSGMPNSRDDDQSYMPLNVGDVRQIIGTADSSTMLMSIVGTTYRIDGTQVYCIEWKWGNLVPDTLYYFNRDGYSLSTELDTTPDYFFNPSINPFNEQRMARLHPKDGELFFNSPDSSDDIFWIARKEEPLKTFCGIFEDVFSFNLYSTYATYAEPYIITYYGKGYGYLGTSVITTSEIDFQVSYIRAGNKTVGTMWPIKNPEGLMKNPENRKALSALLNRIFYPGLDPLGR
jgi:hypothetical protein